MNLVYENNIDTKVKLFNNLINETFDAHTQIKTVRVTKPETPWIADSLKLIMKKRDKSLQKFKRSKHEYDWADRKFKYVAVSIVRAGERAYMNFLSRQNISRQTWDALGQFFH